ncbi:MAG: flippase-like domain-containing protein [Thermoguttaceae bacterium]|nr:flippase-like domain-containing protein [Thermoguttaceae bacterium]MDW8077470.1 lysylphosphatidylglycerol synthase transmembrane domain-containing protein [Thermoguttaceae bacterium]
MKRLIVSALKLAASAALIGYLLWDAARSDAFGLLLRQEKNWWFLVVAAVCFTASAVFCFLRWGYLVRALGVPFSHGEALRIGMIGYLVNLAPMGVVGGDLVKMYMLARLRRSMPEEAVASVLVDRALGLYMLFVVASLGILWTGFWRQASGDILWLCRLVWGVAAGGFLAALVVLAPPSWPQWIARVVGAIPWVGGPLVRLGQAIRRYRRAWTTLAVCAFLTMALDVAYASAVYFVARALFSQVPSWKLHLMLATVSNSAGVVPLPMGPFEFVLDRLYMVVPVAGGSMQAGQGLMVALVVRLFSVILAGTGAVYFLLLQPQLLAAARTVAPEAPQGISSIEESLAKPREKQLHAPVGKSAAVVRSACVR